MKKFLIFDILLVAGIILITLWLEKTAEGMGDKVQAGEAREPKPLPQNSVFIIYSKIYLKR